MALKQLLLLFTLLWTTGPALLADQASIFFDDSSVREIRITFSEANWYNTLYVSHNTNADDPYFPAKFQYGDVVIPQIGIRFKGNSSFRRNGVKKPFKLDFNEYDDNAAFYGLKKLNLHNGDLQPDHLHEKMFLDFAGKYIGAMRAVHVRLYVNDVYYGLYLAVEQPDKTMMQSRFGSDEDGNLYEAGESVSADMSYLGTDPASYYTRYELKTNENANDYSGLITMLDVLNNTNTAELPAKLEPHMDIENVLNGMALNALFTNFESYLGTTSEYFLYQRDTDSRFVHIHWDTNETFGSVGDGTPRIANPFTYEPFTIPSGGQGGGPNAGTNRPLLTKLWAVPEYKRLYLRLLARYLREGFDESTFSTRANALATLFRSDYYADTNTLYTMTQFETAINNQVTSGGFTTYGITQFVRERNSYLRPYLNNLASVSDLRINEIVTRNDGSYRDSAGDADPWVEIFNPGPGPISTSGFYLSDDAANPTKWALPSVTLADGEFLVLWLDGETTEGTSHASFTLSGTGGHLYLYNASASTPVVDNVAYSTLGLGQAYIRQGWYGSTWSASASATPAASNVSTPVSSVPEEQGGSGLLVINEFMADNDGSFDDPDEAGAHEDWFEIYNPGTQAVDMSGMYITDSLSNTTKWQVPAGVSIPAGGYLTFIADGETEQGSLHTSWSLSKSGESISLYLPDGTTLIDRIVFGAQRTDVSVGRTTDGASTWSLFTPPTPGATNVNAIANWVVNGAGFQTAPLAPGSIASAFSTSITTVTETAASLPLPTTLGDIRVLLTATDGTQREAPLFFVSPLQVNFRVPADTPEGKHTLRIEGTGSAPITGSVLVLNASPGLFAANADGAGAGALNVLRVSADGTQTEVPSLIYDDTAKRYVAYPFSLGTETDQVYLVLYGTGIRSAKSLSTATATVGGVSVPVPYAGAQGQYAGLDQVNVGPLPRSLAGKGAVSIIVTVDGFPSNPVEVVIE